MHEHALRRARRRRRASRARRCRTRARTRGAPAARAACRSCGPRRSHARAPARWPRPGRSRAPRSRRTTSASRSRAQAAIGPTRAARPGRLLEERHQVVEEDARRAGGPGPAGWPRRCRRPARSRAGDLAQLGDQHQVAHVRRPGPPGPPAPRAPRGAAPGCASAAPTLRSCSSRPASRSAATRKMRRWRGSTP